MRILTVWRNLCHGGMPPRRSQIDPILFGSDWPNCLLLDLDPRLEQSRLAYVGNNLRDPSWPPLERQMLSDCEDGTLLHAVLSTVPRVLAKGVPISTGGIVSQGGEGAEPVLYRSILLPLGETHHRIDGLLGAASFRIVSVEEELHSFHDQRIDQPALVSG